MAIFNSYVSLPEGTSSYIGMDKSQLVTPDFGEMNIHQVFRYFGAYQWVPVSLTLS